MFTLRKKVIISLISMSLLTVIIGGISARAIMLDRFDGLVADRAMGGLLNEVADYHQTYGSWDAAVEAEPFFAFAVRNYPMAVGPASTQGGQAAPRRGPPPSDRISPQAVRVLQDYDGAAPPILVTDNDGIVRVPTPLISIGEVMPVRSLKNAVPIMSGGIQIGYALSSQRVALSNLEIQYLSALKDALWLSFLWIAAIAIPTGFLLGRRLTAPIKNLSNAVMAMQPGSIHQEVQVTSNDELGQLSQRFNAMSSEMASFVRIIEEQKAKIIETEALRKEGMASVSHELRTPLNSAVAQASAMIDGIRPIDSEQVTLLSSSLDHLTKLVDDMFQLALADVNALECARDIVDIATLTSETVDARYADFTKMGSDLTTEIPVKLEVMGDAKRLRQIIDNLLENCFRYANPGKNISVSLKQVADFAELTVLDSGPGVPKETLGSLFDRFYRVDPSRNRNTGGTGLGLSLVKAWAEAQGGSTSAFLSSEGGLGIKVYIGLAKAY